MYAEAIVYAALKSPLAKSASAQTAAVPALLRMLDDYLSRDHVDHADPPCPLAFMVTDIGIREPRVRATYTRVYRNMLRSLRRLAKRGSAEGTEDVLLAVTALMIGGVAIGRALDRPATVDRLLRSCRRAARRLLLEE